MGNLEIYIIQSLFFLLRVLRLLVLNLEPLRPLALFSFSFLFFGVVVRRSKKGWVFVALDASFLLSFWVIECVRPWWTIWLYLIPFSPRFCIWLHFGWELVRELVGAQQYGKVRRPLVALAGLITCRNTRSFMIMLIDSLKSMYLLLSNNNMLDYRIRLSVKHTWRGLGWISNKMHPASEVRFKNFQFTMIIHFYTPLLGGGVHKCSIHDA